MEFEIRTESFDKHVTAPEITVDYNNAYIKTWYTPDTTKTSVQYVLKVPQNTLIKMLRTNEGSIDIQNMDGVIENIQSTSGDIRLKNIKNNVFAQSVTGNVILDSIKGDVHVASGSGTIDMRLGSYRDATLDASTSSGNCTSHVRIKGMRLPTKIQGNVGHGGSRKLLETMSGDIVIKE